MTEKIIRTYRYRIYPSKAQTAKLEETLRLCCELYNAALQERRDAWRINRKSISFAVQCIQLPDIKIVRPELSSVYAQVLQETLRRVDRAFTAFFGRVRRRERSGFPRFRSRSRYDSLTYPQKGFCVRDGKLSLAKIGCIRIKLHRPIEGEMKTLTVKREAERWFAVFVCETESTLLPFDSNMVGIDVGLTSFATLSDGTEIHNPRWYREAQRKFRVAQRRVARRKRGSNRRRKAVVLLQRAHVHVRQQRADFHHNFSRWLANNHDLIAVEDLNVKGLASGMLAKSVNDAGWTSFINKIAYKAESAGRVFVKVDPRGTSQTCLCGAEVRKTLNIRWHRCESCGLSASRDHVSAQIILGRAVRLQALTSPVAECVA